MKTVGIDVGSLSTKSALMDDDYKVIASDVVLTGGSNRAATEMTYDNVLKKAALTRADIGFVVTTGYGRENVPFADKHVSEITCHGIGMHLENPDVRSILEIGGQDSKAILIDEKGHVATFAMNDKCAAGCGRFLEVTARAMGMELKDLGEVSARSTNNVRISSTCTVFAETEIVSLVADGTPIPDIVKGVHNSIATRAVSLLRSLGIRHRRETGASDTGENGVGSVGMSGGVALNSGVVKSLEELLETEIYVVENPQVRGAIGAAYIGQRLAGD